MIKRKLVLFISLFSLLVFTVLPQVASQWRGPARDGKYPGEKLLQKWPSSGPAMLWSYNKLGEGHGSAAVTDNRVYITGMEDGKGYLHAFDMKGKLLWKSTYGDDWNGQYPGSRITPTIAGNNIYLVSALCKVWCFDKNGKKVWTKDLIKQFGAQNIRWGMTESLLIDGDRLYCTPGGPDVLMAILNRHTGRLIKKIKGNGEKSGYCSPVIIRHGKKRIILSMTGRSVFAIEADSGKFLWSHPHITSYDINPNTPLYNKGYIYIVSGYGTGGKLLKLSADGTKVSHVWSQNKLDSQMGGFVHIDGYIYGSGHKNRQWHCLDFNNGDVKFSSRELGRKGNIIYSDGLLYLYSEKGDMALVKPNANLLEIISSFKIKQGSGPHWAHTVIKKGKLYIRHGNTLMVYRIWRK